MVVGGFAVLDWLRPPDARTHLGRFFATVLDGGLWDVVGRKISVNLRVLTSWRYLVLAIGGVALTWLVIAGGAPAARRAMGTGGPLAGLRQAVPLLRPAVAAIAAALTVGFLMNDSGIVVPATGIALAVPVPRRRRRPVAAGRSGGTVPDEVDGATLGARATGADARRSGTRRAGTRARTLTRRPHLYVRTLDFAQRPRLCALGQPRARTLSSLPSNVRARVAYSGHVCGRCRLVGPVARSARVSGASAGARARG